MDIAKLLEALENDNNENIIDSTSQQIQESISNILNEIELDESTHESMMNKLENYRYIDDVSSLQSGAYIRWVSIKDPENMSLSQGALLCDTKFTDGGIALVCKGFRQRHFRLNFDECLIFQRLSDQERVLLSAVDYLAK